MVGVSSGPNHLVAAAPDTYSYAMQASATKDGNGKPHYSVTYEEKEPGKPPVVVHREERRGLARLHRRNFDNLICRLVCLINEERARNHLSLVGLSGVLTQAATGQSNFQAMTNTMSHSGLGGSNFMDRIRSIGGDKVKDPTENVAMGQPNAEAVYGIWKGSPTHMPT
ncbi:hypothetical protein BDF22DRAFT_384417 [Syncephalis plumigaleata]|nr:hypothetical protein BDF22DRAFT_384417 [Syncephalis plumigaleata]